MMPLFSCHQLTLPDLARQKAVCHGSVSSVNRTITLNVFCVANSVHITQCVRTVWIV